jgi:hypothetical protein
MVSGAATSWFEVNIAAAIAGVSATANATSGLPLALMPAMAEDQRKPRGSARESLRVTVPLYQVSEF